MKFVFDAPLSARHVTKLRTSSTCSHGLSHKVESPTRPASATLSLPFLIQNCTLSNSQYVIANDYSAGRSVDANRTAGDAVVMGEAVTNEIPYGPVIVESGTTTIVAPNGVKLCPGTYVRKGAGLKIQTR